ncbi:MAG: hypothetical protein D6767_10505, partial [Candidatus Hydrogenedentota bacterium]
LLVLKQSSAKPAELRRAGLFALHRELLGKQWLHFVLFSSTLAREGRIHGSATTKRIDTLVSGMRKYPKGRICARTRTANRSDRMEDEQF